MANECGNSYCFVDCTSTCLQRPGSNMQNNIVSWSTFISYMTTNQFPETSPIVSRKFSTIGSFKTFHCFISFTQVLSRVTNEILQASCVNLLARACAVLSGGAAGVCFYPPNSLVWKTFSLKGVQSASENKLSLDIATKIY